MKRKLIYFLAFALLPAFRLEAQLSAGPLSNAHKDLEGLSNCTKCHEIGNKVSNSRCLDCHREIKASMDRNRGYHASAEVRPKDCAQCHSDHHGRNFDMVRFDEKQFNHNLTNYPLTGAHKQIDCRQCHQPDHIADQNLKKRRETFMGLDTKCASCHQDVHRATLGNDCAKCHTTSDFAPASQFNHDKTNFALSGKHKNVQCIECHRKETVNGGVFQHFDGVLFKNCNNCHDDPHQNNLGNNCKECHTEQTFNDWAALNRFNHNKTPFALKGKHKQTACKECHKADVAPSLVFQDRLGIPNERCDQCHRDVHEGAFGTNCAQCHTENSFRGTASLEGFDHDKTHFALEGKHEAVDCKKCHTSGSMTDPVPHNKCASCHADFHEGQFSVVHNKMDCAACHTVDGFSGSSFGVEQHALTAFRLEGAHVATPCFACHLKNDRWIFKNIGSRCVDCHQDIHKGQIAERWYPNQTCEKCHTVASWRNNRFDHNQTAFALQGAHAKQDCRACHVPDEVHKHGQFAGKSSRCADCHEDTHNGQFAAGGTVNCAQCHSFEAWAIPHFDHNKTRFKLDGKHAHVACAACHKTIQKNEVTFVQYKFDNFECVTCHR